MQMSTQRLRLDVSLMDLEVRFGHLVTVLDRRYLDFVSVPILLHLLSE